MGKKVLYISCEFNHKNGANKSASDVLYSLLLNGYTVEVISYSSRNNLSSLLFTSDHINSVKWHRVKRKNIPFNFSVFGFLRYFFRLVESIFYKDTKKIEVDPDLIIVNSLAGDEIYNQLDSYLKIPSVNIFRGSPESFGIPGVVQTKQDIVGMLINYNALIFVSDIVRNKWLKFENLANTLNYYVPNCCEEELILQIKKTPKPKVREKVFPKMTSKFIIVHLASVQYRKGHDLLLSQMDDLLKNIPNLALVFVGDKRSEFAKSMITKYDITADSPVHFIGEKKDALEYLYAADLLAFPSRAEAMPRVVIESMALDTPIVSSDVDGIPELVEHDFSGYLFSLDDTEKMKNEIIDLYTNAEKRAFFAEKAQENFQINFSRNAHISNYGRVIDQIFSTFKC
ncbi:MAG: glycosyltransferase family 4 protein [Reichenbachiella sp.]